MSITLYDLCGADETNRFSPTCWRTKMALTHKKLSFDAVATPFTNIRNVVEGEQKTLPYIADGERKVADSMAIAEYLEEAYPDAPSLFGGSEGYALTKFVASWTLKLHPQIAGLVVKDIWDMLAEPDQTYFRESREKMFGRTLEEVQARRDDRIDTFRAALAPLRMMLKQQPYIGGDAPLYADYIVFGTLKWLVKCAPFEVFAEGDVVKTWFDAIDGLYDGA